MTDEFDEYLEDALKDKEFARAYARVLWIDLKLYRRILNRYIPYPYFIRKS